MNNEDRLKKIVKFVTRRTGADILNKSRQTDVTDARALYYKIALRDTRASMNVIGSVVGKSHATVIHTRNNVLPLIEQDIFYMNIYREYFGEDRPLNPPPKHIFLADTRYHLGTADPESIELITLGWKEGMLI